MQDFFQKDEELFLKVFDEFMNAPWRVEEFPLTREGKVKIEITY